MTYSTEIRRPKLKVLLGVTSYIVVGTLAFVANGYYYNYLADKVADYIGDMAADLFIPAAIPSACLISAIVWVRRDRELRQDFVATWFIICGGILSFVIGNGWLLILLLYSLGLFGRQEL